MCVNNIHESWTISLYVWDVVFTTITCLDLMPFVGYPSINLIFFLIVNLKFWSCKNNHPFFFGYKYSIVFSYSILSVTSWFLKPCARLGISAHWKAQVNSRLSLFDGKSNKILEIYGWKVLFLMKNIRCTMMFSIKIPEWVQSTVKGWVSYLNWLVVNYLLLSQLIFLFSYLPRSN